MLKSPRLRPNAWSNGSSGTHFFCLQRRRVWVESCWNRSSGCPDPNRHRGEASDASEPERARIFRSRATAQSAGKPSLGHSNRVNHATWHLSRESRRCHRTFADHHGWGNHLLRQTNDVLGHCPALIKAHAASRRLHPLANTGPG